TRHRPRARPGARRGPRAVDGDGRRLPGDRRGGMHRRHRRERRQLRIRRTRGTGSGRSDRRQREVMKVACIGMGWWSDVLADAIKRSGKLEIVTCFSRSEEKRTAFAKKYGCQVSRTFQEVLENNGIEGIINTTPNDVHLETPAAAARAGKHVFLDKPIANTIADARAITQECKKRKVVLALGYQRRRESHFRWVKDHLAEFGKLVNAEANISRDRLGKIDLS